MANIIKQIEIAHDHTCPTCNGTGMKLDLPNIGFVLQIGDIVEDHCGLLVRVDAVSSKDNTQGWGTPLNAQTTWILGPNHNNHRIETNNKIYKQSLWTLIWRRGQ